jgi:hypothetical protein
MRVCGKRLTACGVQLFLALLGGKRGLILGEVHLLPLASLDSFTDLRTALAFSRLLVRVKALANANFATCGVFAGEAVQQAAVALASIAVAITRLLVEDLLNPRRYSVSVLYDHICEKRRTHRRWKRTRRNF